MSVAEKAVIGSVIQDGAYSMPFLRDLKPEYFSEPLYQRAIKAFLEMDKDGVRVDQVTISDRVPPEDFIPLIEIAKDTPTIRNLEHYRDIVIKDYHKKRIKETMAQAIQALDVEHIEAIKSDWENLEAVGARHLDFQDHAMRYVEILEARAKGGEETFHLGFPTFDFKVPLVRRGEMMTVAARPSKGKTALLLNMMVSAGSRGARVLYVSGEMTIFQMLDRVISATTGIDSLRIRKGQLGVEDWPLITKSLGDLSDGMKIKFVEAGFLSFGKIVPAIKSFKPDIVFVDFIQRFQQDRSAETRAAYYSNVANRLRSLAIENSCVMIVGCQVSREVEGRKGSIRLSDLKESGGIEEASDVVLALNTDSDDPSEINRPYTFNVIKNRNGPVFTIDTMFDVRCTKFSEVEK